jgi:hypothetical protein
VTLSLTLKHGAAAEIDVPNGTSDPAPSVNVSVSGHDSLTLSTGASTQGADIVVTGDVGSNLLLSGVLNFGSYMETGGRMTTGGIVFVNNAVVLNCDVGPGPSNTQIGGVSGARIEVGGAVAGKTEFVMQGTGQVVGPAQKNLGGEAELIVDKADSFNGIAALDDSVEAFKNLNNVTSFTILTGHFAGGAANTAVELFSGNTLVKTALLAEPSGHNLMVGTGFQGAGTYIYDASAAQMAGFGLTTLPTH